MFPSWGEKTLMMMDVNIAFLQNIHLPVHLIQIDVQFIHLFRPYILFIFNLF